LRSRRRPHDHRSGDAFFIFFLASTVLTLAPSVYCALEVQERGAYLWLFVDQVIVHGKNLLIFSLVRLAFSTGMTLVISPEGKWPHRLGRERHPDN
jgi:hypothetical protein